MRFVNDAGPAIAPVSYPSRVAPLPADRPAEEVAVEGAKDEDLRGEGERIEREAAWSRRPVFGLQVEEDPVPYPTLIPVVKRPQKAAIDLVDALREIKVCTSSDLLHCSSNLQINNLVVLPFGDNNFLKFRYGLQCSTICPYMRREEYLI